MLRRTQSDETSMQFTPVAGNRQRKKVILRRAQPDETSMLYCTPQHAPASNTPNFLSSSHCAFARSLPATNFSQLAPSFAHAACFFPGVAHKLSPGRKLYSRLFRTICFNCE